MTRSQKLLGCMMGCLAMSLCGRATVVDESGNRYHGIVERNVFNLKPPAPAVPPEPPAPPPPKVTLTGIFTILGKKQTGLKVSIPPRPPEPAKEESYILTEGQRKNDIEVLQIDEVAGMIKLNNHGTIQSLNFTNDGAKLVSMPAVPNAPTPPVPSGIPQPPASHTMPTPTAMRTIPTRAMRLPPAPGSQAVPQNFQPGVVPGYQSGTTIQTGPYSNPSSPVGEQQQSQISPEEQVILIEAQRMRYQQEGNPIANLLPPSPLTKQLQNEQQPGGFPLPP